MPGLRTEFEFTLPKGYVSPDGVLHRRGVMRLATARDEIEPLRDRSIDGPDDPYLTILVLARVITELGTLPAIGVREVEGLFAADLAFLQDLYGIINFGDQDDVAALQASVLPASDPASELASGPPPEPEDAPQDAPAAGTTGDGVPADDAVRDLEPARGRARIEEVPRAASQ